MRFCEVLENFFWILKNFFWIVKNFFVIFFWRSDGLGILKMSDGGDDIFYGYILCVFLSDIYF